jgi:hypothetical protein
MAIILMAIGEYFIGAYCWLFHWKLLMVIIDGYFINGY